MKKITLLLLSAVVAFSQSLPLPKATEAQARAGTDNNTVMTPLRTKQAIEENGGGSGTVTSVNGQTGAVTVQPLPTYAALASDALTLGHDNIIRTSTLSATKNLTLSSGGSTGDWRQLSFDMPGATRTVTTDFAVYRNGASSPATVSQDFTDHADITIINMGGGIYRWYDNLYSAQDQPVGSTPTNYTPAADNTKAHLAAIDNALGVLGSTITGIDSAPIGTGQLWTTSDLANRPLNWLVADGTNGTTDAGTVGNGNMTAIIKGGGTVATPAVSNGIVAGTYTGSQDVGVASATAGTSLYYTYGSSPTDPTTSDTLVSGTIPVTATGTLKVKGFKPLFNASAVFSASYTINPAFTYLISDDLIYTDATAAATGGWTTNGGSPHWGYTTATIAGYPRSYRAVWGDVTYKPFTATGDVWVYVKLRVESVASNGRAVLITDGGSNTVLRLDVTTDNKLVLWYGTTGGGSFYTSYVAGTDYHVWLHYVKGTGSNGLIELYRSTDGVRGSVLTSVNYTSSTFDAARIYLQYNVSGTILFNKLRVSATSIGDNPL